MVEIKGLSKVYQSGGQQISALKEINLSIGKGEIFGIIGLSGAGKSTLVRCINMLERPTTGQVIVNGKDLSVLSEPDLRLARQKIGMIFQHFNLLSSRTVADNVAFPLEIAGVPKAEAKKRVEELLSLVGLADKSAVYPAQLSGGQKQRVAIARALANEPDVLLSDEATSALDPQTTASILELLKEINQRLNLTIVLITHEMAVIKEICDRVAVIDGGNVVELGPVLEVMTRPRENRTKELVKGLFSTELPRGFASEPPTGGISQLVRITFVGEVAGEPVISRMVKNYPVDINILKGTIDHINDCGYGNLIVEISGQPGDVTEALAYLKERKLEVEVMGND